MAGSVAGQHADGVGAGAQGGRCLRRPWPTPGAAHSADLVQSQAQQLLPVIKDETFPREKF